jgi:hypothetical protein
MKTQNHKKQIPNSGIRTYKRQAGVTLIEAMISLALSLIVTSGMVILMANSLGTSTRLIHMTQLTDEMRNAMSMMTRDVRRANYSANSIFCYGYSKCGFAGGNALQTGDIFVSVDKQCFTFTLDRNFDGDATKDAVGGFRMLPHPTLGVGVLQMWTGVSGTSPGCGDGYNKDEWVNLTDPGTVNIMEFDINDEESFTKEVAESKTVTFDSRQREIQITLQGQLVLEEDMGNVVVERELADIIYVRNDFVLPSI